MERLWNPWSQCFSGGTMPKVDYGIEILENRFLFMRCIRERCFTSLSDESVYVEQLKATRTYEQSKTTTSIGENLLLYIHIPIEGTSDVPQLFFRYGLYNSVRHIL